MDVVIAGHPDRRRVVERAVGVRVLDEVMRVARAEDLIVVEVEDLIAAQGSRLDRELLRTEAAVLDLDVPAVLR